MQKVLGLSNNTAKMHQVFGKKLYASKYSFISEICQNAVDSHRMAGVTEPVLVGLRRAGESTDYIFYVKDIGLSFDDKQEFVDKVLTILESGKSEQKTDDPNCPMGMHGIGSISPSAYCPRWNYTVVKNNRLFRAVIEEVEGVGLTYDFSPEADDDYEHTYDDKYVLFEIRVPKTDLLNFIQNMKDKLCYYKDIQFEFDKDVLQQEKTLLLLNTDFKLFEADDFVVSTLSRNADMHISLDQYSYPIRWRDLGLPPIHLNVGLKFKLNEGLTADLTRENLQFTPDYSALIKDKIAKVSEWFISHYNDTIPDEYTDLKEIAARYTGKKNYFIHNIPFEVTGLQQFATTKFKTLQFKDVSDEVLGKFLTKTSNGVNLFYSDFEISSTGSKVTHKRPQGYYQGNNLLAEGPIKPKMRRYLKHAYKGYTIYRKHNIKLRGKKNADDSMNYNSFLHLYHGYTHMEQIYKASGVSIWREKIKQFQILEEAAKDAYFERIDKIKIPADFEKNKATKSVRRKATEEIGIKYAKEMERWVADYHCKFVEKILKINDLDKQPYLHVYGTEAQRDKLDFVWCLCQPTGKNKITPCIITEKGIEKIKDLELHNFISVEDFLKGKHKLLGKIVTAYMIDQELLNKFIPIVKEKNLIKERLCTRFVEDLEQLEKYVDTYKSSYSYVSKNKELMEATVELVKDLKLYDLNVWEKFQHMKEETPNFDFVVFFSEAIRQDKGYPMGHYKEPALRALQDCARHRKIRMDWKHYTLFDFEDNGDTSKS